MPSATGSRVRALLHPEPVLDGPTARAWSGTGTASRRVARTLGDQFLLGAVAAATVAAVGHSSVREPAYLFGIAAIALCAGMYLRFATYVGARSVDRSITGAILLVAGAVLLVRPTGLLPMLYLWPLVLSAHYALPGRLAANVALALLSFIGVVAAGAPTSHPVADVALFSMISLGVSVAYRSTRGQVAELFLQVEEMTSRDPLTGALTREAFERALHAWIGHGMKRQVQTSLLVLSVDDLATLRAAHGEEVADAALQHLSHVMFSAIRETDAFGRLGDQEFGLLLPATKAADALIAAERVRSTIARRASESGVTFTVSIGIASEHEHDDPWGAARLALAQARAGGGNRVVTRESPRHVDFGALSDAA